MSYNKNTTAAHRQSYFYRTLKDSSEKIKIEIYKRVGLRRPSRFDDEFMPIFISSRIMPAYWHYIDDVLKTSYDNYHQRRDFTEFVFRKLNLEKLISKIPKYLKDCNRLPRYGGILLTVDKRSILLVRGYSGEWSFPKGKLDIDDNNDTLKCAIREIKEELKYDVSKYISKDEYYEERINHKKGESLVGLYVVRNVDKLQKFVYDKKEIKEIKWFEIKDLVGLVDNDEYVVIKPFLHVLQTLTD